MKDNLTTFKEFMSSKCNDTFTNLTESYKATFDSDTLIDKYNEIISNDTLFDTKEQCSDFYKVLFNLAIKKLDIDIDNHRIKESISEALLRTKSNEIEDKDDFNENDIVDNIIVMLEEVLPNIELR